MIRCLLLIVVVYVGWSSPEARMATANFLRMSADLITPKEEAQENPKNFQIPNPFYKEVRR